MDEITFADMLYHYELKLKEIYEQAETVEGILQKAQEDRENGWKGPASDAFAVKLEAVSEELAKARSQLSAVQNEISVIAEFSGLCDTF